MIHFAKRPSPLAPGVFLPPRAKYGFPGLGFSRPGLREAVPGVKIVAPGKIWSSRGNSTFHD